MSKPDPAALPILTEVIAEPLAPAVPVPQEWLLQTLPGLLAETVAELQPQLEQQLLDALMPRLLASMAKWQQGSTPEEG